MSTIKDRAFMALNLGQYDDLNRPDVVCEKVLGAIPKEDVNVLRMLIKKPFGLYSLPRELSWVTHLIASAVQHQSKIGVTQPFCYLTIRSGEVKSVTDDEWHVDGFSQTITHLPEQNYIWTNKVPTEFLNGYPIKIPRDFDSSRHNIHKFFQKDIEAYDGKLPIETFEPETLYCVDPYIIHRRPASSNGMLNRTFVRISFTPIEIEDVNNTLNPLLSTDYTRDGVKEIRDKLVEYPN
tara:strand:- start:7895 stop:8605 length:711 start_codon:yes stop_codon:yes gene_type:complete